MAVFCVVSSLQNHCLRAVACQLPNHETSLYALPVEIKAKLIHLLSKRGLLTDSNIEKVRLNRWYFMKLASSICRSTAAKKCYPLICKIDCLNNAKHNSKCGKNFIYVYSVAKKKRFFGCMEVLLALGTWHNNCSFFLHFIAGFWIFC